MSPETPSQSAVSPHSGPAVGTVLVLGLVLLAAGLGAFAVWFQWGQTRRSLAFLGPDAAHGIQAAPRVELWSLEARDGRIRGSERWDVSQAPGLVHLRRGLVEDVNYRWADARPGETPVSEQVGLGRPLPPNSWDAAISFGSDHGGQPATILAFDLDGDGFVTVVGRPGRLPLGRIGPGLRDWIKATKAGFSSTKSAF